MSRKYDDFKDVMRELYRASYLSAAKVFIALDYGFDDYEYMKQKLDELFWNTDTFELPIRILSDITYGSDTLVVNYADEYKLTKILYDANKDEMLRLSELRLSEFLKYEEILSLCLVLEKVDTKKSTNEQEKHFKSLHVAASQSASPCRL